MISDCRSVSVNPTSHDSTICRLAAAHDPVLKGPLAQLLTINSVSHFSAPSTLTSVHCTTRQTKTTWRGLRLISTLHKASLQESRTSRCLRRSMCIKKTGPCPACPDSTVSSLPSIHDDSPPTRQQCTLARHGRERFSRWARRPPAAGRRRRIRDHR